jgi:hypothetical protein
MRKSPQGAGNLPIEIQEKMLSVSRAMKNERQLPATDRVFQLDQAGMMG